MSNEAAGRGLEFLFGFGREVYFVVEIRERDTHAQGGKLDDILRIAGREGDYRSAGSRDYRL